MKQFYCLLLALASFTPIAFGQAIQKHGPSEVYYVEDVMEGKNDRLFLSATGGMYFSDDMGDTWQRVDAPLNSVYFHPSFVTNQKNGDLFAWDLEDGIFSTSDNGATWKSEIIVMPSGDTGIKKLGLDGDTLFIGTKNGLYFVQGTDFVRFPTVISDLQDKDVTAIHVDGHTVVVGTQTDGVFISTDLGEHWENRSTGFPAGFNVKGLTVGGSTLYAYSEWMGLYYSNDMGLNWTAKNTGFAAVQVNKIFIDGDNLYAATNSYQNVYRSDLGNGSWTLIDSGIPDATIPSTIYVSGNNIIVGGWHGVFKSNNGGSSFVRSQTGITDAFVFRNIEEAADGTIWASGSHTGFYKMSPGEEIFTPLSGVNFTGNFGSSSLMGDILPIVQDYGARLYNVEDNTWEDEYTFVNVIFADKLVKTEEGIFLSSRQDGVFRYTGSSFWTPFNDGLVSLVVTDLIDVGDMLIAATEDGLFSRRAADPQWERISFSSAHQGVRRLLIKGDLYMLTASDYNTYLSNDAGENWQLVEDLKSLDVSAFAVGGNGQLYAAAFAKIFISPDGQHWVNRDLPNVFISSMAVRGEKIYLATLEQGIWSTSLKIDQQITFTNIPESVNEQTPFMLSTTTTSGLPITYTVVSGPGTIEGNILTAHGDGDIVVRASQAGDEVYTPVTKDHTFQAEIVTAIEDEREPTFTVYPNPAFNTIYVTLGSLSDTGSVSLINAQGNTVLSLQVEGSIEVPAGHLKSGMYYLLYSDGKRTVAKKVLKK